MNEAETRADHIDLALAAAGWGTVEGSRIRREYPITQGRLEGLGRRGKALSADFRQTMGQTKVSEQTKVLGTVPPFVISTLRIALHPTLRRWEQD